MPAFAPERSPIDNLARPLAIAVHDAGAANMIAAWVAASSAPPEQVIAAGPAKEIWQARFGADALTGAVMNDEAGLMDGIACVLTGTGWASDLEHRVRCAAAAARIRSVAVIDHWVNYPMRFERAGRVQLPDAIWVGDEDAARIAAAAFPDTPVELHPNLYLAQQARDAGPPPENGDALFLLEPARSDWGKGEAGEFQALDFFMARRSLAGLSLNTPVRIRPHPSDEVGKYDAWLAKNPSATIDTSPDMATALQDASWVIGMHSAGLVIALEAGRHVICALPPHAPPCALPHSGIARLSQL